MPLIPISVFLVTIVNKPKWMIKDTKKNLGGLMKLRRLPDMYSLGKRDGKNKYRSDLKNLESIFKTVRKNSEIKFQNEILLSRVRCPHDEQ